MALLCLGDDELLLDKVWGEAQEAPESLDGRRKPRFGEKSAATFMTYL